MIVITALLFSIMGSLANKFIILNYIQRFFVLTFDVLIISSCEKKSRVVIFFYQKCIFFLFKCSYFPIEDITLRNLKNRFEPIQKCILLDQKIFIFILNVTSGPARAKLD